jgi:hypothetical protein
MIELGCKFCTTTMYADYDSAGISSLAAAYLFHVAQMHWDKLAELHERPGSIALMLYMLPVNIRP